MSARSSAAGAAMARLIRSAVAGGLLVLAVGGSHGCAVLPEERSDVSISGYLTLKSSEPGTWWAVTDDEGRIWKIASPTPAQQAIFEKAQNQRISIEGRRLEKDLDFERIAPSRITTESNP